jgi:hypothetical protein
MKLKITHIGKWMDKYEDTSIGNVAKVILGILFIVVIMGIVIALN